MKKQSLTRFTALVLLVTMIALVLVCGTFAKYAEEYAGEGTAIVAKWDVTLTDLNNGPISAPKTFDLFEKTAVYDLADVDDPNDLSGEEPDENEKHVAIGDDNAIIAPGTWGKVGFKISIANTNEVSVKYGINIETLTNSITGLEFSTNGTNWYKASTLSDLNGKENFTLEYKTVGPKTAVTNETCVLYWRWLYEEGKDGAYNNSIENEEQQAAEDAILANCDARDLTLGKAGSATCVIKATLGAVQVD